jgi:3-oxoadipate enol-lactonase
VPEAEPRPVLHDTGSGAALLFLHAFPLDASQWDHQVAALSGGYRCLRPDMWGCGETPPLAEPLSAGLDGYAAAVVTSLDALGIDRFIVIGSSMGGYTAYAMWRQFPHRIRGMVLAAARATADSDVQAADRRSMHDRALRDGVEFIVEGMVQRLLGPRARGEAHIVDPLQGRMRRCRPEGVAACQAAMARRPDSRELLGTVTVPTLVVAGDHDGIMGVAEAEAMSGALSDGELVVLPGLGHLPNLEDPKAFSDRLSDFLELRFSA